MNTRGPVTQMIILPIPLSIDIHESSTKYGETWMKMLRLLEHYSGFKRLYWGRQVEKEDNVQLHVGKNTSMVSPDLSFLVLL